MNKLNSDLQHTQRQLNIAEANFTAERDLNRFIVRKANEEFDKSHNQNQGEERGPTGIDETPTEETNNIPPNVRAQQRPHVKKERDFCFYVFFDKDPCPFVRCMFSHDIPNDERSNQETTERMQKLLNEKKNKQKQRYSYSRRPETGLDEDFCEKAFRNGPGSCSCSKQHNLDYDRVRKGACYLYILDQCRWKEKCHFSHQIPHSIKSEAQVIKTAAEFVRARISKRPVAMNQPKEQEKPYSNTNEHNENHHASNNIPPAQQRFPDRGIYHKIHSGKPGYIMGSPESLATNIVHTAPPNKYISQQPSLPPKAHVDNQGHDSFLFSMKQCIQNQQPYDNQQYLYPNSQPPMNLDNQQFMNHRNQFFPNHINQQFQNHNSHQQTQLAY